MFNRSAEERFRPSALLSFLSVFFGRPPFFHVNMGSLTRIRPSVFNHPADFGGLYIPFFNRLQFRHMRLRHMDFLQFRIFPCFGKQQCVGVLNRGKVFVPPAALFIKYQLKDPARFDIVQKRFPHSGFCGVDNKQIKFIVFVHIQVSPLQLLFVHGTTKPQQPCRFRNGNHKAAAAISGSVAIRSSPSTAKKKIIIRQLCAEQRACMFDNSVLRSYAKNLPIRQFCVTQLRKELADSAILCYAKNLPMISTISAPMRF